MRHNRIGRHASKDALRKVRLEVPKQRLWLVEAIEREEDSAMEITVQLRGGHITDKTRGRWREHAMITYVSVCTDEDPGLATILVPIGARSPIATDSLIIELESMIPHK